MTAAEFAMLLHAKQIRRGHWVARCPAHPDKRPSLSIDEGRGKMELLFCCMSQRCSGGDILAAMGLTWQDILGTRMTLSRVERARMADESYLRDLKQLRRFLVLEAYRAAPEFGINSRMVPEYASLSRRISWLEEKLHPELKAIRERDSHTAWFVSRYGWDQLWQDYLRSIDAKELCSTTPELLSSTAVNPSTAVQGIMPVKDETVFAI